MNNSIPEIRVYSPSDKGNESKGSDNLSGVESVRSRSRSKVVSPAEGDAKEKFVAVSPASRSAEEASEETSTSLGIKISILRNRENAKHNLIPKPNIELVKWENTFHSRPGNLSNLTSLRPANRAQIVAINRARSGCITSSAKSLDILRQNLQRSINHDINNIIQKYMSRFFQRAIQNIKKNNGNNSVSDEHVNEICHQILENAKEMYSIFESNCEPSRSVPARKTCPVELLDTENVSEPRLRRYIHKTARKRKYYDSDNEVPVVPKLKKWKRRVPLHIQSSSLKMKMDSVKREGPKWDTDRLNGNTEFIMGAKANKCLGLGATRGRLYNKHADIFRYSGDQEDKQWLYDHNLMPAVGSRVYLLIANDIRELAQSDEYRNCPGVSLEEIVGFTVPESMLVKMRAAMLALRTDNAQPSHKRQRQVLPATNITNDKESFQIEQKQDNTLQEKEEEDEEPKPSTSLEDLDVFTSELQSQDNSCFGMMCGFDDSNPKNLDISPEASDLSSVGLDSPLSAPFDIV